jgi:hypothetical protein
MMRIFIISFIFLTFSFLNTIIYSQCNNNGGGACGNLAGTNLGTIVPTTAWQSVAIQNGNRNYYEFVGVAGTVYEFRTCVNNDMELTIQRNGNNDRRTYDNDNYNCGSTLNELAQYTVTTSGTHNVRYSRHGGNCSNTNAAGTLEYRIAFQPCAVTPTYGVDQWNSYVYDGLDLNYLYGFIDTQTWNNINYDWGTSQPITTGCGIMCDADQFSTRHLMNRNFQCGIYRFTYNSDDGIRISVDGGATWIVDLWNLGVNSGTVDISLNGVTNIVVDHRENNGGASLSVQINQIWSGPTVDAGADFSMCTGGATPLNASATSTIANQNVLVQDFESGIGSWTTQNNTAGGTPANAVWTIRTSLTPLQIIQTVVQLILLYRIQMLVEMVTLEIPCYNHPLFQVLVFLSLNLSFRHYYRYNGTESANVEVSTNGTDWTTLQSWTSTQGVNTNFATVNINLNAYVDNPTLYIRFRYQLSWDWYWCIDDIIVSGNGPLPLTYSWSPATALSSTTILNPTTSTASTITYTLTATANGCSTSDDVTITISDPEITGTTDICVGSTSDLDAGETDWVSLPTGGTISTLGDNERIHTFNSSGVFTTAQTINNAQVLVVGGGGKGGANGGGGGGAGGVIYETGLSIATGSPAVTVGLGATTFAVGQRGATGGSSTFLTYTAGGGGGGGGRDTDQAGGAGGGTGGSGGGGGNNLSIGGAGSTGGNNGGTSSADFCASTVSGGGGGAGGPAGLVTINANRRLNISSAGGIGVSNSISGSPITYGVGGMGIAYALVTAPIAACGAGTDYATDAAASDGQATRYANGTANRGNGGGGGAGNGGDGVVIVRYRQPKWVSSDPSIASVNELTGVVTGVSPGSATITYYSVSGCSSSTSVTISEASTAPTLITGTGNSCHGTEVTLTASGSTLASGSDYEWFTGSCGGTAAGTGASITVTPTASTTYYVRASGNSVCPATACINGNVTLPTAGTNLSTNGETATCVVEGSNWIRFYAPSGNLILAINPNGEDLGNVTVTSYVGAPGTMFACDNPGNTFYETAYMGRSWIITSENPPTNPVSVQYPFSNGELNALETLSLTTLDNLTDDVDDRDDLVLTKFTADNPAEENATPTDNCTVNGVTRVLNQASNGANPYGLTNAQYVIFNLSEFSENFLHGSTGPSALPVELTSFSATCNADFVQLNWTTGSELNSDKFIIESSRDLSTWNILGEVKSAGNSSQVTHYQFVDEFTSGLTYYRLRQVDFDGKEETFSSIFANCSASTNSITVYPNPTKGEFTIVLNSEVQFKNASLIITDISGKTIVAEPIQIVNGHTEIYKDLAEFKSGTYFIYIKTDKNTFKPVKIVKAQ